MGRTPAWVIGVAIRVRGSSGSRQEAVSENTSCTIARWEIIAALGRPVVPPVYCSQAMSSSSALPRVSVSGSTWAHDASRFLADVRRTQREQMFHVLGPRDDLSADFCELRMDDQDVDLGVLTESWTWSSTDPSGCSPVYAAPLRQIAAWTIQTSGELALSAPTQLPFALPFPSSTLRTRLVLSAASA